MSKSIIIIGAGVAGLSAGCYGQMNGYRTRIFELHDKAGGLCTSWKRKGYTFDGSIHWLVGSREGSINRVWQELGAVQGRRMVDHEEFTRIVGTDGRTFIVYTNIDRLEQHMKELAPADDKVTAEFIRALRRFSRFDQGSGDPTKPPGLFDKIKGGLNMLPFMPALLKYSKMTVQDFGARFSDPLLRQAFPIIFDLPDCPMVALLFTLAWMHNQNAGYPIGGSLAFAQGIERRYIGLGGEIGYKSRVEKILTENGRAVGVRLTDGSEHRADVVISAADGHATIFDMLGGKYVSDEVRGYYDELPIFAPMIQVSLGVARDLSAEPQSVSFMLDEPLTIAGKARSRLWARHYGYDPTMAPEGKTMLNVLMESDHAYWEKLYQERERYDAKKKDIAIKVIAQLEERFPGITGQVEVADVATPMTYIRYTGNWQGSMEGWLPTPRTMSMREGMDKTLPGLENFYMVGQWVEPGGGLPPAATSGRGVIQMICKGDDRPFEAKIP